MPFLHVALLILTYPSVQPFHGDADRLLETASLRRCWTLLYPGSCLQGSAGGTLGVVRLIYRDCRRDEEETPLIAGSSPSLSDVEDFLLHAHPAVLEHQESVHVTSPNESIVVVDLPEDERHTASTIKEAYQIVPSCFRRNQR